MKNIKAIALLVVALVCGLAAAVMAAGWVSRQAVSSNKVVVAAADIEMGSRLNPQMLQMVDWPSGSTPPGAFTDLKALQDRVNKVAVLRGEPILEGKLAPLGTRGGLSAVISEGKRAMTVRVNDVVGVAGFALPGTYVDVMVNTQQDDSQTAVRKMISKTVLEHVLVLAVAQEAGRDDTKPKVVNAVTLELTPQDSEKLDLARSVGTLSLVLRNQVDKTDVHTVGATKKELFGLPEATPVKLPAPAPVRRHAPVAHEKPAAPKDCVEVIHNGMRSLDCF